mgnify:CR=1 FL=1
MRKTIYILLAMVLAFTLTACSSQEETSLETSSVVSSTADTQAVDGQETADSQQEMEPEAPAEEMISEEETANPETNTLVVYFSATGNTRTVAELLAEQVGADLFEIVPEEPYTEADLDYTTDDCRANVEQNDPDARPAMANAVENIDPYDVIYVGFPIWWGTMPKILNTFFDETDLAGKTIAPFCTSGGSGISAAVDEITALESDAEVTEGLRTSTQTAEEDLAAWLTEIGLAPTEEAA